MRTAPPLPLSLKGRGMLETGLDILITYNPWTLSAHATAVEVARQFDEMALTSWPVVDDDGHLLGSVSTHELATALASSETATQPIANFMDRSLLHVAPGTCPLDALQLMLDEAVDLLPVVDQQRVVGTLTTSDFLRELSYGESPVAHDSVVQHLTKPTDAIDGELSLEQAYEALLAAGKNALPVVQGDFPLGAISRRRLRRLQTQSLVRQLRGDRPVATTLGYWMQSTPSLTPGRSLGEAASLMVEHQLHALAVTNQAAHLLGIITEDQILAAILHYER
ncbi:MAG TPA: CBS domain-containing protein [Pirellulaceae bacterium]|nr:CBS domain-containing protein [Pirellulaceae bacterium]